MCNKVPLALKWTKYLRKYGIIALWTHLGLIYAHSKHYLKKVGPMSYNYGFNVF